MSSDQPQTPSSQTPWWISDSKPISAPSYNYRQRSGVSWYLALAMALLAGFVGALIGSNRFSGSTGLVSVSRNIERAPNSVAAIAARVSPSVVEVDSNSSQGQDTGTGFFIQSDGYILTNNHVVEPAVLSNGKIKVKLSNNRTYTATLIGRDTAYDLAVLKIPVTDAPALTFGDSDKVQVGDPVIAIGSPLGLAGTVTLGIISAKNRPVTTSSESQAGENSFINALQTDAAINPGNSGGPLVDINGAVIGVNSAIASLSSNVFGGSQPGSIGLGFAIPIKQARITSEQLIKTGHSTFPIVGMSLDNRYTGSGARVADTDKGILPGGPAEKAGIKRGDIIIEVDGKPINTADEMVVTIRSHQVGDTITLKFMRGKSVMTAKATLVASKATN
jgi:putative serine protease PepD